MIKQTKKIKRHISNEYKILNNPLKKIILKNATLMKDYNGKCCNKDFDIDCLECPNLLAEASGVSIHDCSYIHCISLSQKILDANQKKK
ncbi:MAG TPA: hypothetical protein PLR64_00490 [Candidatus Dojkabacteria bacterium]|nr:hypothetical protein [Candidatus Dojkabacteria bacterium]